MWPLSPKEGGRKTQNGRFPSKIALRLKKVCYKVSLTENCQRQSCKAFIGLTIRAKMIGGGHSLLPEMLGQTDRVGAKSPIFDLFSFGARRLIREFSHKNRKRRRIKKLSRKVNETGLLDLLTGSGRPRTSTAVWCSVEQLLIDGTVDQWPAHLRAVFKPKADILNIRCDNQFVFSALDDFYASCHA